MSDLNETRTQLAKADYYFGECNSELEEVQGYAGKAEEFVKEMGGLLLILGEDWYKSAENSELNIGRADKIISNMEAALRLMNPIYAEVVTALGSYLMEARQKAKFIKEGSEDSLAAVNFWPIEGFTELSSQMTDDAEVLGQTAQLSQETQQHFTEAMAACQEYKETI